MELSSDTQAQWARGEHCIARLPPQYAVCPRTASRAHPKEPRPAMSLLDRFFSRDPQDDGVTQLYAAIVDRARRPHWYEAGAVPDTVDGRFDMVAAVLSLVLLRLEGDPAAAEPSVRLTERFVTDMDGQLRQIGIGDIIVGKHIGKMMSALGGRLGAYRDGLAGRDLDGAIIRNIYRGETPEAAALAHLRTGLTALAATLAETPTAAILGGSLPE
jgi:cytochrome b pre-mRNA-processing protein 3